VIRNGWQDYCRNSKNICDGQVQQIIHIVYFVVSRWLPYHLEEAMEVTQNFEFRSDCSVPAGMSQPSLMMDIEIAYNDDAEHLGEGLG
jgi:hypothetical protein